jgi:hypothetical protein
MNEDQGKSRAVQSGSMHRATFALVFVHLRDFRRL